MKYYEMKNVTLLTKHTSKASTIFGGGAFQLKHLLSKNLAKYTAGKM
jgi:hypothetical protein